MRSAALSFRLTRRVYAPYAYGMKMLGERIRELRDAADMSLRDLGKRAGNLSPVFLSDIELGRRFPSEDAMAKIAAALGTTVADLRQYDTRPPVEEMKRRTMENPALGIAFRKIVELSPERLLEIAKQGSKGKK